MTIFKKINYPQAKHAEFVAYWLFFCCFVVFCMIIVGAVTRLSDSGLSMVEWRPLLGALPPLNEAEWERVFSLYQAYPEFQKKHFWMEIGDFKHIFFWEWFHRLLGRVIGVVYALPFIFFLIKGWIPKGRRLKLFGIFLLGGAQGFMGWYMVKSGLVDQPAVSHYRLAAHLSLALLILSLMLWQGLSLLHKNIPNQNRLPPTQSLYAQGWVCVLAVCATILWGAFTAGLDAGLVYNNTFPKMGAVWIPEEVYTVTSWHEAFIQSHAGVQFIHRWLALMAMILILIWGAHAHIRQYKAWQIPVLAVVILVQVGLGVATLFSGVHLVIATTHQAGAVIVLCLLLGVMHKLHWESSRLQSPKG